MSKKVSFIYQVTAAKGWRRLPSRTATAERITARASRFLPLIVDFLKRRPPLDERVFVVLQVRELSRADVTARTLGTLLLLQQAEKPSPDMKLETTCLLAPATYVEATAPANEEESRLAQMLGKDELPEAIRDALLEQSWSYDLVLELLELDEEVKGGRQSALLTASVRPVPPRKEQRLIDMLWRPGAGTAEDRGLTATISLPWYPPEHRFKAEKLDHSVVYLMSGSRARTVLREVDQVWQRPSTRNLLLAAEPGSGKEVVSKLIHYGRARGRFVASSIGGERWDSWKIPLLGLGQPSGPPILTGFIEDANGGTLLVDEVEKGDAKIREALLRVIEADEFHRPESAERILIRGEDRPLFVFAGSGNGPTARSIAESLRGAIEDDEKRKVLADAGLSERPETPLQRIEVEPPSDFWQRMDRRIVFFHPLGKQDDWDLHLFREYVALFLWRARDDHRGTSAHVTPYAADRLLSLAYIAINTEITRLWPKLVRALSDALFENQRTAPDDSSAVKLRPRFRDIRSAASEYFGYLVRLGEQGQLAALRADPEAVSKLARQAVSAGSGA